MHPGDSRARPGREWFRGRARRCLLTHQHGSPHSVVSKKAPRKQEPNFTLCSQHPDEMGVGERGYNGRASSQCFLPTPPAQLTGQLPWICPLKQLLCQLPPCLHHQLPTPGFHDVSPRSSGRPLCPSARDKSCAILSHRPCRIPPEQHPQSKRSV